MSAAALAAAGWSVALVLAVALGATAAACRRRLALIARAEHELRGPLTALGLAIDALAGRGAGGVRPLPASRTGEARAPARNDPGGGVEPGGARPSGERPLGMLDHHLDRLRLGLADLEAARRGRAAPAAPERLELRAVAREAAAAWSPAAAHAGRPLRLAWRAGAAPAFADRARLSQAVGNLLANAVEHGDGPLELHGRRAGDVVRVEVRNDARRADGPPLPDRHANRRGRASSESGRRRGLGLAIAGDALRHAGGRLDRPAADGSAILTAIELPLDEGA